MPIYTHVQYRQGASTHGLHVYTHWMTIHNSFGSAPQALYSILQKCLPQAALRANTQPLSQPTQGYPWSSALGCRVVSSWLPAQGTPLPISRTLLPRSSLHIVDFRKSISRMNPSLISNSTTFQLYFVPPSQKPLAFSRCTLSTGASNPSSILRPGD